MSVLGLMSDVDGMGALSSPPCISLLTVLAAIVPTP